MTTATTTKFLYNIWTPNHEGLDEMDGFAFTTTYESDEYLTAEQLISKLLHEDDEVRWSIEGEGHPCAADGGWCVELETEGECYELTTFTPGESSKEIDPSSMTLEEVKAIYAELEDWPPPTQTNKQLTEKNYA